MTSVSEAALTRVRQRRISIDNFIFMLEDLGLGPWSEQSENIMTMIKSPKMRTQTV